MYEILRNLEALPTWAKWRKLLRFILAKDEHHYTCREDSSDYFKKEKALFPFSTLLFFLFLQAFKIF